ncbi:MAG: hypothetical protein ACO1NO_08140 [Burkholderiaceae bacterium]
MDKETRKERLRLALASRKIKPEHQSYISQLLSGKSSFGEKAARKLEREYLLPAMFLDQPFEAPIADHVTKDALIEKINLKLRELHVEKLKALANFLDV